MRTPELILQGQLIWLEAASVQLNYLAKVRTKLA